MGATRRAGPQALARLFSFPRPGVLFVENPLLDLYIGVLASGKGRGWMFRLLRWLFRRRQPRVTYMQWIVAENVKATTNLRANRLTGE